MCGTIKVPCLQNHVFIEQHVLPKIKKRCQLREDISTQVYEECTIENLLERDPF